MTEPVVAVSGVALPLPGRACRPRGRVARGRAGRGGGHRRPERGRQVDPGPAAAGAPRCPDEARSSSTALDTRSAADRDARAASWGSSSSARGPSCSRGRSPRSWPSGRGTSGCRADAVEARVARAADRLGVTADLARSPFELPAPRRRLVAIAAVLAMEPRVLVLDEPTTGQDARTAALVAGLIRDLRDAGTAVVCVSHDMPLLAGGRGSHRRPGGRTGRRRRRRRGGCSRTRQRSRPRGSSPPRSRGWASRSPAPTDRAVALTVEELAGALRGGTGDAAGAVVSVAVPPVLGYAPGSSWLHRANPLPKLAWLARGGRRGPRLVPAGGPARRSSWPAPSSRSPREPARVTAADGRRPRPGRGVHRPHPVADRGRVRRRLHAGRDDRPARHRAGGAVARPRAGDPAPGPRGRRGPAARDDPPVGPVRGAAPAPPAVRDRADGLAGDPARAPAPARARRGHRRAARPRPAHARDRRPGARRWFRSSPARSSA